MADELRSGLWAVLFSDLVESTALLARVGEHEGASIRQALELIASRSVAHNGGVLVKGTGDGVMAAFVSVVDAIDAAVEMQQRVHRRNQGAEEPTHIRIGVSVGEVVHENGDLFGMTVNEAARVCATASGDHILITDVARSLAGSRLATPLADPTRTQLKGIPGEVTTWEVVWTPAEPASAVTLPRELADDAPFAGRGDDLEVLTSAWSDVRAGAKRLVLVAGEPGIGKTALAGHLARRAQVDGGRVLFGACHDGAVVPFQPFAEALDGNLEVEPFGSLGADVDELARLAPRVLGARPIDAPAGEADQYRLFEAVVAWLAELSTHHPVVLVLDDLHWATSPTVAMLRHVMSSRHLTAVLTIGTYRDTDLDRSHPLASTLPELHKRTDTIRVQLRGLPEPRSTSWSVSTATSPRTARRCSWLTHCTTRPPAIPCSSAKCCAISVRAARSRRMTDDLLRCAGPMPSAYPKAFARCWDSAWTASVPRRTRCSGVPRW